jgi:outer membrane protein TolC
MNLMKRMSMVLVLTGVAGCKVDQAADVNAYRSITDIDGQPMGHRKGEALSVKDALQLANSLNERLGIEGERYVQALAERQRRAAALRPTLDAFGNVSLRDVPSGGGSGGSGSRRTTVDAGLTAQYTLLTGQSDLYALRAADIDIRARRWLLLDLRESLLLETATAYYRVMQAERLIEVLKSSVAVQEERLRDATARQEVGFVRPLDVAQIEAQRADTRVQLLDAMSDAAQSRSALALLTGASVGESPLSDGFEPETAARDLESFLRAGYEGRQDLLAAGDAAEASRIRVDEALGRYFPTIAINLDWFLHRDSNPTNLDLLGLISVTTPLFSGGELKADLREAWSVFRETVMTHQLTRRQVRSDVERAFDRFSSSNARIVELRAQVRASEASLRQAEASYSAGLATNLERVAAQDQLLNAQLRAAREDFERKLAYLELLRACGRLSGDLAGAVIEPTVLPEPRRDLDSPFVRREVIPE